MANYIIVDGELYHHGVKGMKWGVRRARKSGDTYESIRTRRLKKAVSKQKEAAKSWDDTSPMTIKSLGNTMKVSKRDAEMIRDQAYERLGKLQVKLIKSQMADEIYAGQSIAGKLYSKVTGSHRIEADIKYDLDH